MSDWLATSRKRLGRIAGARRAYRAVMGARFELELRASEWADRWWTPPLPRPSERLTVILLSFGRPRNIQPIAERVLRCDFVDQLIVRNNNPAVRMEDHLALRSPRLEVVSHSEARNPIERFHIARAHGSRYFLALDDDVFMRGAQIESLFRGLVAAPGSPRGVIGQRMLGGGRAGEPLEYRLVRAGPVDVLNRVYAFTATHRDRFFTLLDALYRRAPELCPLRYGDDIVLSFCGARPPALQNVSRVVYCPSGDDPSVARWREPGFAAYRSAVYRHMMELSGRA